MNLRYVLSILFFVSAFGHAETIRELSEDFTVRNAVDADTTAVWNLSRHSLHLPLIVDRSKGVGGAPASAPQEDDVLQSGTGKDGAFNSSTYASFDINGGSISNQVVLDTSRVYEFTDFDLTVGTTLKGSGSAPLRIRVQGDATVAGSIVLSGAAGTNAGSSSLGGAPGPGGGRGGNGGTLAPLAPQQGSPATGAASGAGGGAGVNAGAATGGGGGGNASAGGAGASSGGAGGATYGDPYLTTMFGGSGGGGGGARTGITAGAGGGGGGGALDFHITGNIHVDTLGAISATGGAGGNQNATTAGPGGGGSGGGLRFLVGNTYTNDALIDARGGAGGTVGFGVGSDGRIYVSNSAGTLVGQGTGNENPPPTANPLGQTFYSLQTYRAVTGIYDSQNSRPKYLGFTVEATTPAGTSVTLEVAGSNDQFVSDDTGFGSSADLDRLESKRYFRYRLTLVTSDRTVTPEVTKVTARFEERTQTDFNFGWRGCATTVPGGESNTVASMLLGLCWFLGPLSRRLFALRRSR